MNTVEISNELIQFIESSPSMFHSIKTIRTYLEEDGFTYLPESCAWDVKAGGKYYRKAMGSCFMSHIRSAQNYIENQIIFS